MADRQPFLTLNSGYKMPQVGLGTFMAAPNEVENAVLAAIDTGYRHIDCAHIYGNECEVGKALKTRLDDGTIKREDVFITSKLWCNAHRLKDVRPACEESLRKLGLEYLDLYLVHWPVSFNIKEGRNFSRDDPDVLEYEQVPLEETWKGMENLVEAGLVRSIGVSNFNKSQIDRILAICKIPPAVNQIEVSVNWLNEKMVEFAHSKGIQITAYAPFGSPGVMADAPPLLEEEFVKKIASAHGKTPAQVLIRHAIQRNLIVIPKSKNVKRIEANFDVFDFTLTTAEMEILKAHSRNCRLFKIPSMAGHPEYPFNDEF
uniref:1,5-anhydro-D-fructose reductase n=2 Tax=Schistocephalus solidus TaxID=70667 RepID=A0A0X3PHB8_SCHSO